MPETDPTETILTLEAPLRKLAVMLARDEVEAILSECLDDVYESDDD